MERGEEREEEREDGPPDQGTAQELYKLAGAISLIGLEFFVEDEAVLGPRRIRLDKLNRDGTSYQISDVRTNARLDRSVTPGELTIGLASRRADEPVIALLRGAKIGHKPYLKPGEDRPRSVATEFLAPETGFEAAQGVRRSAPPFVQEPCRQSPRAFQQWVPGRGIPASPLLRRETPLYPRNPMMGGIGAQGNQMPPRFAAPFQPQTRAERLFGIGQGERGGEIGGEFWQGAGNHGEAWMGERGAEGFGRRPEGQERGQETGQFGGRLGEPGEGRYGEGFWGPNRGVHGGRAPVCRDEQNMGLFRGGFGLAEEGAAGYGVRGQGTPFEPAARPAEIRGRTMYGEEDPIRRAQVGAAGGYQGGELENRIAALESLRRTEMVRAGISTEMRRMLSAISPAEHPGIYTTVDQFVTLYECPPTHRGPMCVAGACGGCLKEPHIKLAFLAEATWQFARRKCAEGGKNLTKQQIRDIEAQVLEFYGRQKVEGSKILDKAGIIPGRGGR
jgi:hypothetical protein